MVKLTLSPLMSSERAKARKVRLQTIVEDKCSLYKRMDTKGGKPRWGGDGGMLNWAIGIDMYTLMCIKLMTD